MSLSSAFRLVSDRPSARAVAARNPNRPHLETLEDRWLPSVATHLSLTAVNQSLNGFNVIVRALDQSNRVVPDYLGRVHFTTSDPAAGVPPDFTFTLNDLGTALVAGFRGSIFGQIITGTDTQRPSVTGTLQTGVATQAGGGGASVLGPVGVSPGTPFELDVGVTQFLIGSPPYAGTVHFTSTDAHAALPPDYTFTAADEVIPGVSRHTFSGVVMDSPGPQIISASDDLNTRITPWQLSVGPYFQLDLDNFTQAGQTVTLGVEALRESSPLADYTGSVRFVCSDPLATLPGGYKFKSKDGGAQDFQVTFRTAGDQLIQVFDTATNTFQGSRYIEVLPGAAINLMVTAPPSVAARSSFSLKVTPVDRFGNLAMDYQGMVHFTSPSPDAQLPGDYQFHQDEGAHAFLVGGLRQVGQTLIRVTDSADPGLSGTVTVAVTGGPSLLAAGTVDASGGRPTLGASQAATLLREAVALWQAAGVDTSALGNVRIEILNLGGRTLGSAAGTTIRLDDDAAGFGWFVDKSPTDSKEFFRGRAVTRSSKGGIDALSVIAHELGHLLGKGHSEAGVMAEALQPGERHLPAPDVRAARDALFARWPATSRFARQVVSRRMT